MCIRERMDSEGQCSYIELH